MLVVEDYVVMQTLLVDALRLAGVEAEAIARGDKALEFVRERRPELILLDVSLVGPMSGLDVLRAVREDADLDGTQVVLLTGRDEATRSVEAQTADLVLHKPFSPRDLIVLVRRLLNLPD